MNINERGRMLHQKYKETKVPLFLICAVILVLVAIALMTVLNKSKKEDAGVDVEQNSEKSIPVSVMTVIPKAITDMVKLPGKVEPFKESVFSTEKGGRIARIHVEKGESVKDGDVLLELDALTWEAMRRQAEIAVRSAKKSLNRISELKTTGAVSISDYDNAVDRYETAQAALLSAEANVSQCVVKSKLTGVVEGKYVEEGEFAREGGAVIKVIDISKVKVVLNIPEQDVNTVELGKSVSFRVSAQPEIQHSGEVMFVARQADKSSNSFPLELLVDNAELVLKAGMITEVDFVRGEKQGALVLPLAAVIPEKGNHVAYAVENLRAVRKVVRIDSFIGHEVVIASGIKEGDKIVIEGHRGLQDGVLVEVK